MVEVIFKETNVGSNITRFIPFVLWLKKQPRATNWFRKMEKEFSPKIPPLTHLFRMRFLAR